MKVRRYIAATVPEAMDQVRAELGSDAVILHTRAIRQGGFFGFFGKKMVEVTAAVEEESLLRKSTPSVIAPGRQQAAQQAYRSFSPSLASAPIERDEADMGMDDYEPQQLSDFLDRFRDHFQAEEVVSAPQNQRYSEREEPTEVRTIPVRREEAQQEPQSSELQEIKKELQQTQALLRQVAEQQGDSIRDERVSPEMPKAARRLWKQLVANDVDQDLATELMNSVLAECHADTEIEVEDVLRKRVLELVQQAVPDQGVSNHPEVIALVGPTGVGKTTTLAKLAAYYALVEKKKVGLITIDTYRIAAVEQLKTYARILDLQVQVVFTPQELPDVLAQMSDCDVIFLDTAGRSHKNAMQMSELRAFFEAGKPTRTYLVLSMTTKYSDMVDIIAQYEPLNLDTMIFTKLDETTSYGNLFNIIALLQKQVAYITDGQSVPEDINQADPFEITDLIMGKRNYA